MELTFKSLTLYLAVLLTGLSAGLFYAWAVSVIPGTRNVTDLTYLQTMQAINRAILNPGFYTIFFGSLLLLVLSAIQMYGSGPDPGFWWVLAAILCYLLGTLGVTIWGNVPMNEALDAVQLSELGDDQIGETRQKYEGPWNRLHMIRTAFSVLAFALSLVAAFTCRKGFQTIIDF